MKTNVATVLGAEIAFLGNWEIWVFDTKAFLVKTTQNKSSLSALQWGLEVVVGFGVLCCTSNKHTRGSTVGREARRLIWQDKGPRGNGSSEVTQPKSHHGTGQRGEGNWHFHIPSPEMSWWVQWLRQGRSQWGRMFCSGNHLVYWNQEDQRGP